MTVAVNVLLMETIFIRRRPGRAFSRAVVQRGVLCAASQHKTWHVTLLAYMTVDA